MNSQKQIEYIKHYFPKKEIGCHHFNLKTLKCDNCKHSFEDWYNETGIRRIKLCAVISLEELGDENE